ncbi:MAG: M28 family peptidase [Chloroflexi bacterium]|nr:M28 family peptidase [Chloroflexota bacterium]
MAAFFAVACIGIGSAPATPTAEPTATALPPTATPDPGPPQPEVRRVLEHIRVLSDEIGARVAGSPAVDAAAAYAAEQFRGWGYDVELQEFTATGNGTLRYTIVTVEQDAPLELAAVAFGGSGAGAVGGTLVDAGTGLPADFPPEAAGAIVLIQRLDVPFADMARRAEEAGALGFLVANKEPGLFPGRIEPETGLPAAAIGQADGEALRELLAAGPVEVTLNVRAEVAARNVIARPPSGRCRTVSGGHYDGVPWADSANDNASGSALVLELARAVAAAGLADHCFALFGAEELGLLGSALFVEELTAAERDELEVMFNHDASAGSVPLQLIGSAALADEAQTLATLLGFDSTITQLPERTSSDHASFLEAGIPALMLTAAGNDTIHTPADTFANLIDESLAPLAELGFALLETRG